MGRYRPTSGTILSQALEGLRGFIHVRGDGESAPSSSSTKKNVGRAQRQRLHSAGQALFLTLIVSGILALSYLPAAILVLAAGAVCASVLAITARRGE